MCGKGGEKLKTSFPNMLLIGSTGRNSGKTVLACTLIRHLSGRPPADAAGSARPADASASPVSVTPADPARSADAASPAGLPVIGLKVTTIHGTGVTCPRGGEGCGVCSSLEGDFCITRETGGDGGKDTVKMLEAGASAVFWLRVRAGCMDAAVEALGELIPPGIPVVTESNTLRLYVKPGIFLMVKPKGPAEVKPSAKRVIAYADRIIEGDRERTRIDFDDVSFTDGRFFLRREATLVLLAGGGSSRMGAPKSLLDYRGVPLLIYIYNRLAPLFAEVLVSVSSQESIPRELERARVVVDGYPGRGPIAGIAAGLRAASYDAVFVSACDIPTLHEELILDMLGLAAEYDAVVPRTPDGLLEPLHAVYKRSLLPQVVGLIEGGERRIRMLYDTVNTCYKDLSVDQDLTNINTPEEYRSILTTGWPGPGEESSGGKTQDQ